MPFPQTETQELVELEVLVADPSDLIVYNDDHNTFDHVINTLVEICSHSPEQAEQCTWIIHFKGRCAVKKGSENELSAMCRAILDRGINAEVLN